MIERLIRPHLRNFEPYHSARSEMQNSGDTAPERIFLDANELALGSSVSFGAMPLNRYPDPFQHELRSLLAARLGLSTDRIFAGVGSDEIIDLLIRLCCEPGLDNVVILEPTYGVYQVAAALNNVGIVSIQLDKDFQIDVDATLNAITPQTKILFCCSPNNPSGNLLRKADLFKLCKGANCLVVIDEAYAEFADPAGVVAPDTVNECGNLVVLRTLSKAWGLAGIRLGYCIAHPLLISYLLRVKAPYNINAVTAKLARDAVRDGSFMVSAAGIIRQEREGLADGLMRLPCVGKVYPSDANFLLVEFRDAKKVFDILNACRVIVRRRSEPRLSNCLRITVGTPRENSRLLEILNGIP